MTARVLLSGVLHKPPVRKTSKNGKPYVVASIRENSGRVSRWWKVFAFSESAIAELERAIAGEPVTMAGTFEAEIWTPEGKEPRVNFIMTADGVLTAKPRPKARAAGGSEPRGERR